MGTKILLSLILLILNKASKERLAGVRTEFGYGILLQTGCCRFYTNSRGRVAFCHS